MGLRDILKNTFGELKKYLNIKKTNVQQSYAESKEYVRSLIRQMKSGDGKAIDYHFGKASVSYFYLFGYDSLLFERGELPHFDRNPLLLVLSVDKKKSPEGGNMTYILGINFHWLLPITKSKIIAKLIQSDPQGYFNDRRIAGMNYKKFKTIVGGTLFKQCVYAVRLYRFDRIRMMGSGVKVMRVKNSDITKTLGFSVGIYEGCSKSEAMQAIRKAVNSKGGKLPPLKKKKPKKKKGGKKKS